RTESERPASRRSRRRPSRMLDETEFSIELCCGVRHTRMNLKLRSGSHSRGWSMTTARARGVRRAIAATGGLLLSASILSACGDSSEDGDTAAGEAPGTVAMDLRNDVDTFDPFLTAA